MSHSILVCDDDTHIRCILAMKLRSAGHVVHEARDGEEGFAKAVAQKPSLILTDYQMPNVDGLSMALKLAADPATQDIPLVMLTARGHSVGEEELAKTRIRALVDKPFSAKQVMEKVAAILSGGGSGAGPTKEAPRADAA
jgi:two-component system phosphate regulon response regulator PhoB